MSLSSSKNSLVVYICVRCDRTCISKKEPPIIIHHTHNYRKTAKLLLHVELLPEPV